MAASIVCSQQTLREYSLRATRRHGLSRQQYFIKIFREFSQKYSARNILRYFVAISHLRFPVSGSAVQGILLLRSSLLDFMGLPLHGFLSLGVFVLQAATNICLTALDEDHALPEGHLHLIPPHFSSLFLPLTRGSCTARAPCPP